MDEPFSRASCWMCSIITASYDEFSRGTSIRLYMPSVSPRAATGTAKELDEKPDVESRDYERYEIGKVLQPGLVHELAHLHPVGRERDQREHGKGKLHAQDHLA